MVNENLGDRNYVGWAVCRMMQRETVLLGDDLVGDGVAQ
jgi:hypothetical protein